MNSQPPALSPQTLQTVYGSLVHHCAERQALGEAAQQAPYNASPKAPVLYIKPANTFSTFGQTLYLPVTEPHIRARACVGLIHQKNHSFPDLDATKLAIKNIVNAEWHSALLCDFTLPHSSFYRPPLRFNALDGSLALPQMSLALVEADLQDVCIETWVNGQCVHSYRSSDWEKSAREQLEAVSEFIAWEAGDVLMLGCPPDAPLVKVGDIVETRMNGQVFTRTLIATQEAA